MEGISVKSAMILAALCAALSLSAPLAAQAATTAMTPAKTPAKGMSDVEMYCKFFPWTAKCASTTPAKAAVMPVKQMAMAKPAAPMAPMAKPAHMGMKMMTCVKAAPGQGHLFSCTWK
jgi:hypothetical protein